MNKPYLLFLLVILVISAFSGLSGAEGNLHIILERSGLNLPALFEDDALSDEIKATVIEDLKVIFSYSDTYKRSIRSHPKDISLGNKDFKIIGAIYLEHERLPDGFEQDYMLICVEQETQTEYIIIPKHLSDAYRAVLELKSREPEAFAKLDDFLSFMNILSRSAIIDINNLLYPPQWAQMYISIGEVGLNRFVDEFAKYRYKKLSILEIKRGTKTLKDFESMLITRILILNKENENDYEGDQLIVFHEGSWKIVNFDALEEVNSQP